MLSSREKASVAQLARAEPEEDVRGARFANVNDAAEIAQELRPLDIRRLVAATPETSARILPSRPPADRTIGYRIPMGFLGLARHRFFSGSRARSRYPNAHYLNRY